MIKKIARRLRIKASIRSNVKGTAERPRLTVFRSNSQIYAQVINDLEGKTLASASSLKITDKMTKTEKAAQVGKMIAEAAKQAGVEAVNPDSQEGTDESAPLPDTIYVEKLRVKIPAGECDYTGEVNRDSVPNGKGVAVFVANGDKVEAMFTDGNISDDNAVYTIARSKDVFKGSIKDKDFVQGTYIVADGSYFTGTFKGNVPYSGKWYNKNGSFYAEMKNGQMAR